MATVPERFQRPAGASAVAVGCGVFALLLLIGGLALFGLGIAAIFDVLFRSQLMAAIVG
jgi:hypothetical protein